MQIQTIPWTVCVGVALALAVPGCGDESPPVTSTSSSGTGGAGRNGGAGGARGGGGSEVVDDGQSATELVTAGESARSKNYKMIFTFGQPTQNQGKTMSPSYHMQGGLVGANGS